MTHEQPHARQEKDHHHKSGSLSVTMMDEQDNQNEFLVHKYSQDHPMVCLFLANEKSRTDSLQKAGKHQMNYPKSNDGWIQSLFILKGRALNHVWLPWTIAVLHATCYCIVQEIVFDEFQDVVNESWDIFFAFVLNSTLAFLLVFRLNRAATRYWLGREFWGTIVARGRTLVGGILLYGRNAPNRDEAIQWTMAFSIATMEHLRGIPGWNVPMDHFAGILSATQIRELQKQKHMPLYAVDQVRHHLQVLFHPINDTPMAVAYAWTQHLQSLEQQVNKMMDACGGMERIRGTPLPIVYVSHLRTFLMISLLLFPYVWGSAWEWMTIPIVAVTAFAWLGIEAASAEVECPFSKDRVNALDMSGYCLGLLSTVKQQIQNHADADIRLKQQNTKTDNACEKKH